MSDNLSVFEAPIAASEIKCSGFTSAKWVLSGGSQRALQADPVSPLPWEKAPWGFQRDTGWSEIELQQELFNCY